jgi:alpha-N-arabinofuranosidase
MEASEYGLKAADAARQMRAVDPALSLIACGSSGPDLPSYLDWDRQVLEQCYEYVDGLSLHRYVGNTMEQTGLDSERYLALNLSMERQIAETLAVCDFVRAHKRSPKALWLSFDEWNVWYRARGGASQDGGRQEAPHLLEEVYNLEDALLVGGMINTLMRHADRVKIACLAQLINVIAPIMTNERGLLRQSIYFPYSWALQLADGAVLNLLVQSPAYNVARVGDVPYIDAAATHSTQTGKLSLFILNRDLTHPGQVELDWQDRPPARLLSANMLTGDDLKAFNSFDVPTRVVPTSMGRFTTGSRTTTIELPPRSYAAIQWQM